MNDLTVNIGEIPVACSLTPSEFPARRELLARVGQRIAEAQERANDYVYRFDSDEWPE